MAFIVRLAVRLLAWVWTQVLTERIRVRTMWFINQKVAVRVVGIVRGADGAILMVADTLGQWSLPVVSVGRFDQPQSRLREHLEGRHGIKVGNWRPVSARRLRHAGLDCVYMCDVVCSDPPAKAGMAMKFKTLTNLDPSVDVASREVIEFVPVGDWQGFGHV